MSGHTSNKTFVGKVKGCSRIVFWRGYFWRGCGTGTLLGNMCDLVGFDHLQNDLITFGNNTNFVF